MGKGEAVPELKNNNLKEIEYYQDLIIKKIQVITEIRSLRIICVFIRKF